MKITEITNDKNIYSVKQTPNWIERIFGIVEKTTKYKRSWDESYGYGEGGVYYNQKGEELGYAHKIGVAIDNWRRRF